MLRKWWVYLWGVYTWGEYDLTQKTGYFWGWLICGMTQVLRKWCAFLWGAYMWGGGEIRFDIQNPFCHFFH